MTELAFLAKKLVGLLLLPPAAPLVFVACGLVLMHWRRRAGLALAWLGLVYGLLACLPASVVLLLNPLESDRPPSSASLREAQAIVILAGGRRSFAPEFGGETVNRLTLERVRYGARLARQTGLPVLVTGGAPTEGTAEAELMRRALIEDFAITPRWVEDRSLDTRENAERSAPMLKAAGVRRIILVTHAIHMPRSRIEFERQGFEVIPAPTGFLLGRHSSEEALSALPGASSAYAGWYALHEWLGLLAQRLMGQRGV